jgi:hypothetical protein
MYMMKTRTILLLALLLAIGQRAWAQASESLTFVDKTNWTSLYTFNYPSVGTQGEDVVLSAALVAWTPDDRKTDDGIESVHIFSHITITSDKERPSVTTGGSTERSAMMVITGRTYGPYWGEGEHADYAGRCIIIAPDYEGYGLTKDKPHPYLQQRLTARQVIDGVNYGMQLYRKEVEQNSSLLPIKDDFRSYSWGFSQGGSVALAVHRHIEENNLAGSLHFQGSICGDGPYDLITTLRYYFDDNGDSYGGSTDHRKGIVTLPVVMPLIIKGMCSGNEHLAPYGIEEFLSQQMIDTGVLGWIDSKEFSTEDIVKKWYQQVKNGLEAGERKYTPEQMAELFETPKENVVWGRLEKMMTPACYEYLANPDNFITVPTEATNAMQALHIALAENSTATGWTPQHRIKFCHSKNDMVVPYGNYQTFRDAHTALEGNLFSVDDAFSDKDHVEAGSTFYQKLTIFKNYGATFNWLKGGPTSIHAVWLTENDDPSDNAWYDLQGRQLSGKPTQSGIYITKKGRKVLYYRK